MYYSFHKYQALNNDYILFDIGEKRFSSEEIIKMCSRKNGIGADGILFAGSNDGTYFMDIYNSDGSRAAMCGNGLRCVLKYLNDTGHTKLDEFVKILTPSGDRGGIVIYRDNLNSMIKAQMGKPEVIRRNVEQSNYIFHHIDTGNPHYVAFVNKDENCSKLAVELGPVIENSIDGGVNVGFAKKTGDNVLELAVWERGSGFTLSCGTGATAAAYVGVLDSLFKTNKLIVKQQGGDLVVNVDDNSIVYIQGETEKVFSGTVMV
jgi:diaminopimelate epimerase